MALDSLSDRGPRLDELWWEHGRTDSGRVARAYVALSRQELRTASVHAIVTAPISTVPAAMSVLLMAVGVVGALSALDVWGSVLFATFSVVWVGLTFHVIRQNIEMASMMPTSFEDCVYRFTETSVSVTSNLSRQTNPWSDYKSCHMLRDGYLLRSRHPYSFIFLPRRAFITPDDEELFFELARTHTR